MQRLFRTFRTGALLIPSIGQHSVYRCCTSHTPVDPGDDRSAASATASASIPPSVMDANDIPQTFLGPVRQYVRRNRVRVFGEWICPQCTATNCGDRLDCFECGGPVPAEYHPHPNPPGSGSTDSPQETHAKAEAVMPADDLPPQRPSPSYDSFPTSPFPDEEEHIVREVHREPGRGARRGGVWSPRGRGRGGGITGGRGATSIPTEARASPTPTATSATPAGAAKRPPAGGNPGDWHCSCGAPNFHYRYTCFKCSKRKP